MEPTPGPGTQPQPVEQKGVETPLVVSPPVALLITFAARKHKKLLKRISDWEWEWDGSDRWNQYMKGIDFADLPRLKMNLPPARNLVGLADGRVVCFWSSLTENLNEIVQRFVHDLNTLEVKTSIELLGFHSIVICRKPSLVINTKAFKSIILDHGEVFAPKWFLPLPVQVIASSGEIPPPTEQKESPLEASAKKSPSKSQVKKKTNSKKRAGEPLEERQAKRVESDVAPNTSFAQAFTEFCNKNLYRIKALDYRNIVILEHILEAVKGKLGSLSYPALISTLQARDSSPLKVALSLIELLDVHHSLLLSLTRDGRNANSLPQQPASTQSTLPAISFSGKESGKRHYDTEATSSLCGIYPSILQTLERHGFIQKQVEELLQSVSSSASDRASGIRRTASHPVTKEGGLKSIQELNVDLDVDVVQERLQWIDYQRDYWKLACSTNNLRSSANPFRSTLRNFIREGRALVTLLEMVLKKGSGGLHHQSDDTASVENSQLTCTSKLVEGIPTIPISVANDNQETLRELGDRLTQAQAELEEANRLRGVAVDEVRRTKQEKKLLEGQVTNLLSEKRNATAALKAELARRIQAEQTVKSLLDIVIDVETVLGYNTSNFKKVPETLRPTAIVQAL